MKIRYCVAIMLVAVLLAGCAANSKLCRQANNTLEDFNEAFETLETAVEALYAAGELSEDKYAGFCALRDKWHVAYTSLEELAALCSTPESAQSTLSLIAVLTKILADIEAVF